MQSLQWPVGHDQRACSTGVLQFFGTSTYISVDFLNSFYVKTILPSRPIEQNFILLECLNCTEFG